MNFGEMGAVAACAPPSRGYTRRPMPPPVKTSAAAPERSLDQRMEALKRANDIRTERAQLKRDLKAGQGERSRRSCSIRRSTCCPPRSSTCCWPFPSTAG